MQYEKRKSWAAKKTHRATKPVLSSTTSKRSQFVFKCWSCRMIFEIAPSFRFTLLSRLHESFSKRQIKKTTSEKYEKKIASSINWIARENWIIRRERRLKLYPSEKLLKEHIFFLIFGKEIVTWKLSLQLGEFRFDCSKLSFWDRWRSPPCKNKLASGSRWTAQTFTSSIESWGKWSVYVCYLSAI